MAPYRRRYSVSAVGKYHECPQSYKFHYIDRVKTERKTVGENLRIGTAVHAGLEAAAGEIKFEGTDFDDPSVLLVADDALTESWRDQELPMTDGRLDDAKGWMRDAIEKWDKDGKIQSIEWEIRAELPSGSAFIGYADRIDRVGEDTLEVRDYKNTKGTKTAEELEHDLQVNMYGYFARETWPWAENILASHQYPNHGGKVVRVRLTDESMQEAVDTFESTIEMIESDDEQWEPRIGQACNWCDYKPLCPAWTTALADKPAENPDQAAIDEILKDF